MFSLSWTFIVKMTHFKLRKTPPTHTAKRGVSVHAVCGADPPEPAASSPFPFVLQRSGSGHRRQPALHPPAPLHRLPDGVDRHRVRRLGAGLRWAGALPVCPAHIERFWTVACLPQGSGSVTGSTALWAEGRRSKSSSLTPASPQTSAFTCSAARRGSSSVSSSSERMFLWVLLHHLCLLAAVILLCAAEAVFVVVLVFLRSRLSITVALLKEGSQWVSGAPASCSSDRFMNRVWFQGRRLHRLHPLLPAGDLLLSGRLRVLRRGHRRVSFQEVWIRSAGLFHVSSCDFNSVFSFLASSGNAVYKVVPSDERCAYANVTCSPKVWLKRQKRAFVSDVQMNFFCSSHRIPAEALKFLF